MAEGSKVDELAAQLENTEISTINNTYKPDLTKTKLHERFQHTSHHGIKWASGTYCVMEWDDQVLVVEKTSGGPEKHAERNLIEVLDPVLQDHVLQTGEQQRGMTIYINRSSCDACVPELIKWKDDKNLKLNLIYAGLYQCHRVSCDKCDNHNADHYKVNTEKMQELMKEKNTINVRGFKELRDWTDLRNLINRSNLADPNCEYSDEDYTTHITVEKKDEWRLHEREPGSRQDEDNLLTNDIDAVPDLGYNEKNGIFERRN